ncbi:hypothetical protein I4100191B2_19650 [Clostridiales bacterium]
MDIRIKKTKRSIINAFLELRSRKPLEKVTVKELCEKAEINKSTFYTHFTDVYDLSDQLEDDVIQQVIAALPHPEYALNQPRQFTEELFIAFRSQSVKINSLFSGSQRGNFIEKLNTTLRKLIFSIYPQYQNDTFENIYLDYAIFGGYYAMINNKDCEEMLIIDALGTMTEKGVEVLKNRKINA